MAESDQRAKVVKALKPLDAVAVENPARPGTPDVNHKWGWLELKWLRAWPKKSETPVALDHLTNQQRIWAKRRHRAGGQVYLLLQCKQEWMIFHPNDIQAIMDGLTREQLYDRALVHWTRGLKAKELIEWLENN